MDGVQDIHQTGAIRGVRPIARNLQLPDCSPTPPWRIAVPSSRPMTYPRAHLVDTANGGFYHCISRCVRRSWLCGRDALSGRSFEHRRAWLESRLLELADLFAVDLYGYAVMSNHYHCVLAVVPQRVAEWDDGEVAARWCALCPGSTPEHTEHKRAALEADASRVAEIRQRLASLSWFMRFLNEPIARRANREDGASGRFWEGRFKSIALLDEAAVVACMAYVDLNPVRAGIASGVDDAVHTAIHRRIARRGREDAALAPLTVLGLTLLDYRALLEWTVAVDAGRVVRPQCGAAQALSCLQRDADAWLAQVKAHRFKYRAYGALSLLRGYAEALGQRYLWGCRPGLAAPG